jgi:hypothetical protein
MIQRPARCLPAGIAWLLLGGCGSSDGGEPAPPVPVAVDCSRGTANCRPLTIAGTSASPTPTFTGFADPSLFHVDPEGLTPPSYFGSESSGLTAVADAGGVTGTACAWRTS